MRSAMRTVRRTLVTVLFVVGCARTVKPEVAAESVDTVLERSRARELPATLRARFHLHVESAVLEVDGGTGAALITDRPGRGHIAVFGPFGTPLITLSTDGAGLSVVFRRAERHLLAADAEAVIRQATGGVAGVDDFLGLFLGDLPLDDAKPKAKKKLESGQVEVVLPGPEDTLVSATLDPATATPVAFRVYGRGGDQLLSVVYEPFETLPTGELVPTELTMEVPSLAMVLDARYRSWTRLDEAPDVFSLAAPDGFATEPLELVVRAMVLDALQEAAESAASAEEP